MISINYIGEQMIKNEKKIFEEYFAAHSAAVKLRKKLLDEGYDPDDKAYQRWHRFERMVDAAEMHKNMYDFDNYYIQEVLRWKLARVEKHIREHGMFVTSDRITHTLRVAIELLKRINEDDFITDRYSNLLELWWGDKWVELPNGYSRRDTVELTRHQQAQMNYERKLSEERRKLHWDLLFKIMHRHMRSWWD